MTNWVYRPIASTGGAIWAVGFYNPQGVWIQESTYPDKESAAKRVHWLNGGGE